MCELVVQRNPFGSIADWDGQRWLEILLALRLSERGGLFRHRTHVPRNKRQVSLTFSSVDIVLTACKR